MIEPTVHARHEATRCAWCHDGLEQPIATCGACGATLHAACKALARGCVTLGCAGEARAQARTPGSWTGPLLTLLLVVFGSIAFVGIFNGTGHYRGLQPYGWADHDMNDPASWAPGETWRDRVRRGIELFDQAERNGTAGFGLYVSRGEAHRRLGNHDPAIADFRTALRLQPDDPEALRGLARVRRDQGNHALALTHLTKALQRAAALNRSTEALFSDRAAIWRALGMWCRAAADDEQAQPSLRYFDRSPGMACADNGCDGSH